MSKWARMAEQLRAAEQADGPPVGTRVQAWGTSAVVTSAVYPEKPGTVGGDGRGMVRVRYSCNGRELWTAIRQVKW